MIFIATVRMYCRNDCLYLFLFQESGSSFSPEDERAWLKNRHDKLKKTLRVLTSGPDRMLKCIETKNHSEFVYVNELLAYVCTLHRWLQSVIWGCT